MDTGECHTSVEDNDAEVVAQGLDVDVDQSLAQSPLPLT